jgi:23S rRNA (guanosine2251-2'-O)-methyltransferase
VILYGRNPVREALRGCRARSVKEVWAVAGAAREPWLAGVAVRPSSAEEIERRCGSPAHQGICAHAGPYPYADSTALLAREAPLLVALDQVQDPQNLGSICRTAECAGAAGVVIAERRAAEVTPAVCKASAGAVEHLPIARVRNIADFLLASREAGCWSYGASAPDAGAAGADAAGVGAPRAAAGARGPGAPGAGAPAAARRPVPYDAPDYSGGVVLVLGSEGQGLRPRVASVCDELIALPMHGRIESLGVSAAAAAIVYEILHNRRRGLDKAP